MHDTSRSMLPVEHTQPFHHGTRDLTVFQIDLDKLQSLGGYKSRASASTTWSNLRKKILSLQMPEPNAKGSPNADEEANDNDNSDNNDVAPPKKKAAAPRTKGKVKAEAQDEDDQMADAADGMNDNITVAMSNDKSTAAGGPGASSPPATPSEKSTSKKATKAASTKAAPTKTAGKKRSRGQAAQIAPEDEASDDGLSPKKVRIGGAAVETESIFGGDAAYAASVIADAAAVKAKGEGDIKMGAGNGGEDAAMGSGGPTADTEGEADAVAADDV